MEKDLHDQLPGNRRLLTTWLALMALTVLSMWSAQLGGESRAPSLPMWSVALVLLSAGFKVRQILMIYLNLRVSSAGWRGGFLCLLAVTILLVGSGYWAA
jgi:hypothetical protein